MPIHNLLEVGQDLGGIVDFVDFGFDLIHVFVLEVFRVEFEALGKIEVGYTYVFIFCAIAYLLAWGIMKVLVPKFKPITDL